MLSIGQKYRIKDNHNSHQYPIGSIVTVDYVSGPGIFRAGEKSNNHRWWVMLEDCIPAVMKPGEDCLF